LNIPKGVRRVLFRTLNTDRGLMWKAAGDMSYVGFTEDGAQWLVDNTDIKLVGIDYISVAAFDHLISAHVAFFKNAGYHPSRSPETRQREDWTIHAALLTSETGWL
uniref:Uncharacterized protein n=1 Tax=Aegilops tauschii subsp. strangulata TaxID=200361 RepID=A0A453NPN2_AEGTS